MAKLRAVQCSLLLNGWQGSLMGLNCRGVKMTIRPPPSPCSAEIRNERSCTSIPPTQLLGVDREQFTFCGNSFIHLVVCLTTGPKPLQKRALYIVRSRASSFKWEYPVLSLGSSSSILLLLPRLPVTSIQPSIFPSITRCRRQFLRKMWPIQLAFRLLISFSCGNNW